MSHIKKPGFVVLETTVDQDGRIWLYGGILPSEGEHGRETVAHFRWWYLCDPNASIPSLPSTLKMEDPK